MEAVRITRRWRRCLSSKRRQWFSLKGPKKMKRESKTPFRPDTENLQCARDLQFEPPLDDGIREIVIALLKNGVETFESCEGGRGHSYAAPTVCFEGASSEGLRALSVALAHGLPVCELRRVWGIRDAVIHGPWWEMTFIPPRDSPIWADRDTTARYAKRSNR